MSRSCDGCTKCCEGWLRTTMRSIKIEIGSPCPMVNPNVGCTIHKTRPTDPCKQFYCQWIVDEEIPYYLKPNISDVIITRKQVEGIPYMELSAAGKPLQQHVLSWFFIWGLSKEGNIAWTSSDVQTYYYGTSDFCAAMKRLLERWA